MSILDMGSSFLDDLEMKEGVVVQLKDDTRNNGIIENVFDYETEFEFWPIQHPTEPSHEDRPVQCPIPHSSHLINERKRPEASSILHKENSLLEATKPPIRTVRKRHHDHTDTIMPLWQTPPAVDSQSHKNLNTTVFSKVHQVHGFES